MPEIETKNLSIIYAVTFVSAIGASAISPALPAIAAALRVPNARIGLLFTLYTLPGIFLAPVIGVLADRVGRKPVLIVSLFYYGVVGWLTTFTGSLSTVLVLRFLHGIGFAALITFSAVLVGDLFQGEELLRVMGYNIGVLNIAALILPLAGGALALLGWYFPFYLSLLSVIVGFFAFALKIPEPKREESIPAYLSGALKLATNIKAAGAFSASVVCFILIYGVLLTYFTLFLSSAFGATTLHIGIVLAVEALAAAIFSFLTGMFKRYASEGRLVQISFLVLAVSSALIPFSPNLWFALVPSAIFGFGVGILFPSILAIVTGLAPLEKRAAVTALNTSMIALGQTLGPLIAVLTLLSLGIEGIFFVLAAIALVEYVFSLFTLS